MTVLVVPAVSSQDQQAPQGSMAVAVPWGFGPGGLGASRISQEWRKICGGLVSTPVLSALVGPP